MWKASFQSKGWEKRRLHPQAVSLEFVTLNLKKARLMMPDGVKKERAAFNGQPVPRPGRDGNAFTGGPGQIKYVGQTTPTPDERNSRPDLFKTSCGG